jgi:hypothetical protein
MNSGEPVPAENRSQHVQPENPGYEEPAREQEVAGAEARDAPVDRDMVGTAPVVDERSADGTRVRQPAPTADESRGMGQSELAGYRDRFADLQTRFIDDPRGATDQACSLVKEAVDRMMDSMLETGDTEQMRVAMQRYRNVLETIAQQTQA